MVNKVFYFSATGNSLAFARALAAGLGGTELVPIVRAIADPSLCQTAGVDRVGLIFPVRIWGLPRLVSDFAKSLKTTDGQYVFAVATCGGVPGNTLRRLAATLRRQGGRLDAGFAVREPAYLAGAENPAIRMVNRAAGEIRLGSGAERLVEIMDKVRGRRTHSPEVSRWSAGLLGDLFHGMTAKMTKSAAQAYLADGRCDGCGVCERICPRSNVRLVGGKPQWQSDCEMCQACIQWCPQAAIQIGDTTKNQPRNHRPGITLGDVLVR